MSEVIELVNLRDGLLRFGHLLSLPVGQIATLGNDWMLSVEPDWAGDVPGLALLLSNELRGEHLELEVDHGRLFRLPGCEVFFVVRAVVSVDGLPSRVVFEFCEQRLLRVI